MLHPNIYPARPSQTETRPKSISLMKISKEKREIRPSTRKKEINLIFMKGEEIKTQRFFFQERGDMSVL